MKPISISKDIIPIGEFKMNISKWFKNVLNTGQPLVITQNGKPAGVLLSPKEYDELVYKNAFLESVNRGLKDSEEGRVYTTDELISKLADKKENE